MLKEIHKELNLGDVEDGDLIHTDEDSDKVANGAVDVMAYWHVGLNNYVISRRNQNEKNVMNVKDLLKTAFIYQMKRKSYVLNVCRN